MSDCQHDSGCGLKTGDVQTKGQPTVGKSREELVDALSDRLDHLTGDVDVSEIEEILAAIDEFGPVADDFDVEASLARFYEDDDQEMAPEQAVKKRGVRRFARIAIIAAVLICIAMTTVQASGFDLFGAIVDWANEKFYIVSEEEKEQDERPDNSYASLQDALEYSGIPLPLVPKRFPERTQLVGITVRDTKGTPAFLAEYDCSGEEIMISIRRIDSARHNDIEIDTTNDVEVYIVEGITHNLVADVRQQKALWKNGEWSCSISTTLNRDQLIAMIDSVYS